MIDIAGETIFVVDDDIDAREIITMYLENEQYQVITAIDGIEALSLLESFVPDLIILDMMMPGLDGIEVCQEIRKKLDVPIIFLSAKGEPIDKSFGLIAGADDYMSKPFEAIELMARIKAQLRRNRLVRESQANTKVINYPGMTINLTSHTVQIDDEPVLLAPKEFQLLTLLAQNPNKVFSPEELFNKIWETESFGDNRTVMVHISNLRRKTEKNPAAPRFIHTIKGVGYKFTGDL